MARNFAALSQEANLTVYLIKEELKSRRFFSILRQAGLDDCFYQADFSTLILDYVGLDDESDEISDFYYSLMEKYSAKVVANPKSVIELSFIVYAELIAEKERRGLEL